MGLLRTRYFAIIFGSSRYFCASKEQAFRALDATRAGAALIEHELRQLLERFRLGDGF
jgi:hypothetical protein